MAGNESTNQRPAFGRKSLECDSTLIRSGGHLGKFTVPIWKQYDEWLWRQWSETIRTNTQTNKWSNEPMPIISIFPRLMAWNNQDCWVPPAIYTQSYVTTSCGYSWDFMHRSDGYRYSRCPVDGSVHCSWFNCEVALFGQLRCRKHQLLALSSPMFCLFSARFCPFFCPFSEILFWTVGLEGCGICLLEQG